MKKLFWIIPAALALFSCAREMEQDARNIPSATDDGPELVSEDSAIEADELAAEPGVALVYLDVPTTARLEENPSAALSVPEIGITGMERLFPHAGEYEPRTRREGLHRWYVVEFDKKIPVSLALSTLSGVEGVDLAEKSYRIKENVSFNDPYWTQNRMWGMNNVTHPEFDINCEPVWEQYTTGNPNVVVAVVDGGIQLTHPDLRDNIASSGHYNYVSGNSTISQHYHGVHVAGTIAAVNNNGTGVTGIAGGDYAKGQKGVKLLSLQVFRTNEDGTSSSARSFATALKEAADKGAHISQNSWGYNFDFNKNNIIDEGQEMNYARSAHNNPERSFTQAVDYFNKYAGCDNDGNQLQNSPMKGGVVIFAAGNDNIAYGAPGNYDGCISVGALAQNGSKASFSNYGNWVDICAPGVNIYSTYLNGSYHAMSGTSMACPHVSGVAALVVSYFGGTGFTADELRARLIAGAKSIGVSTGATPIGPLVDAYGSFQVRGDDKTPEPVRDYTVSPTGHNLKFEFTANEAYGYMLMASTSKTSLERVNLQQPAADIVTVNRILGAQEEPGTAISVQMNGLTPDTDYYVALVGYSYSRKYSAMSPIRQAHTNKNNAPVIEPSRPLEEFTFRHYEMVDIPFVISEPDGDEFTVKADVDGRAVFESTDGSVGIQHFKLICPLVNTDTPFRASITATDDLGADKKLDFTYRVLPNEAPGQVKDFGIIVLNQKDQVATLNLDEYIQDPDGEPLDYRVSSTRPAVATAAINAEEKNLLEVTGVAKGTCEVRISATDHDNRTVNATAKVIFRDPSSGDVTVETADFAKTGLISVIPGDTEDTMSVRLISASGIVVYTHSGTYSAFDPLSLDLRALAPGIYTLEVSYKGKTYTYPIVKR